LDRAAAADPTLRREPIQVVMTLSWPLPWLLAGYQHVGHWSGANLPPGDATVLLVDQDHRAAVEARLRRRYLVVPFKLSPAHAQAYAYFDAERFAGRLPAGTPVFAPPTE
ncbi:MAG TPA: hypothetical protein VGV61_19230, partial [Thermoanaerobaculia bacterium]|nr:hypothetical protein [Thermoanaerobaculia bacterium]